MSGPLAGVRILEMTAVVLGPWACQILADMGAEVIKVEPPRGDSNRTLGAARSKGMSALYLTCNRNKRSVVLDVKQPAARAAVLKIAESCDVVIHNNRAQVMDKLGLAYKDFRAVNPKIIYCGTYGYGRNGPYGARGALDDSIQAISGIAMLNEMVLGEPRYLPTVVADKTTAMAVVQAVTAALYSRERTGRGQEIEVPMFETMVYFVMAEHLWGMSFEPPIGSAGYTRLMSYHRKPYKTLDGYIAILPYLDNHWETFCKVSGHPELITDPRFRTLNSRVTNIDDTYSETAKIMATRTTGEWLAIFGETSVPTNAVNSLEDLVRDPHLKAVDFWQEVEHPTEGRLRMTRFPYTFSETPAGVRRLQPRLGEHSVEVLREAGLAQADIDAMLASGATLQS
ncbi:MAG: CoA transferase [Gammaproteobacteria bacterium]|nr:MAG: CoA transferase [Pseudomonadota bacterium]MBC6945929.1 CoA transferase [Gammaproteobacteria bacterium]MCE7895851.1 CoA transferase [Gammaproteobacteria bacterium PRO8]MDL1881771.1 CoA transferase [Gammaproteobacteria bacterium PRO2]MCQ3934381.1 CoA transferase [Gammaproteobacteria bacterium]